MEAEEAAGRAEVLLANPFLPHPERAAAERDVAAAATRPTAVLDELVRRSLLREARRLVVAMALVEHGARGDSKIYDPRAVPERLLQAAGIARLAVREAVAAAVRTVAAIRNIAGVSAAIAGVRAAAWKACFGESVYDAIRLRPLIREQNVLILGETGTGKELVAQAIAAADPDPARAQVVNAAAIPRDLLEAELFGAVKGAYTGALSDRQGRIVAAEGGTLFLDEIADLPAALQAKLLRVIEDDRVTPLGSNQAVKVDVRYLCATSQPLVALVERGEFRRDLYERLAGVTIRIPPLRERLEDLAPTADSLFQRHFVSLGGDAAELGASTTQLSKLTVVHARLRAWLDGPEGRARTWNGNVRELASLLRSWILGFDAPPAASSGPPVAAGASLPAPVPARFVDGSATLRDLEDWYILHVLDKVQFRQRKAAEILGIDRGTLARRLRQLEHPDSE